MKIYKGRFSFFFFRISISKIKFQTISSFSFDTRASLYDNPKDPLLIPLNESANIFFAVSSIVISS